MKKTLFVLIAILLQTSFTFCQSGSKDSTLLKVGKGFNIEVTTGFQGSLSFGQVGINLPQFVDNFVIGLKFRGMSSTTWNTFIHEQTKESVSFHPVVVAGIVSFGGTNLMVGNSFRAFGTCEILFGYSFTPYDDMVYNCGNLIGSNTTVGLFGTFGLEFFVSDKFSTYIESGGGFKTVMGDKDNPYVVASRWQGSGATLRMGTKIYF